MKALGLPNTKHFHEITKIEDAIACESLHSRLYMNYIDKVRSGGEIES